MFCQKCGAEIPNGNEFCPNCGEALSETENQPEKKRSMLRKQNLIERIFHRKQYGFGGSDEKVITVYEANGKKTKILLVALGLMVVVLGVLLVVSLNRIHQYEDFAGHIVRTDYDDTETSDKDVSEGEVSDKKSLRLATSSSNQDGTETDATSGKNSKKTKKSEKYYSGTNILSFESVTGRKVTQEDVDDDGTIVYTYEIEEMEDVTDYTDALEEDGYEISTPKRLSNGQYIIGCRKGKTQVLIGRDGNFEEMNSDPNLYLFYYTNSGLANCSTCSYKGYDSCQGHTCDICKGRGSSTCNGCHGTGMARVQTKYTKKCAVCYGQGTQVCPNCKGAGKTFVGN